MLTQEYLKTALSYNQDTGEFIWNFRPVSHFKNKNGQLAVNGRYAGRPAGSVGVQTGYLQIGMLGKKISAHRLAWLYVYGYMPNGQMDHINHDRLDNRICNLRLADSTVNNRNSSISHRNSSGVVGVSWVEKNQNWRALITVNYKGISLGTYRDKFDAICARKSAENKYGFHLNHGK